MPSRSDLAPRADRRCATCADWHRTQQHRDVGNCSSADKLADSRLIRFGAPGMFAEDGDQCRAWRKR